MTDKDGGSDMNSTPISKLPPPMMSGGEAPPIPQGASYQDILKSVDLNRNSPSQLSAPMPMQQMPQHNQHMQHMQQMPMQEDPELQMMRMRMQAQAQAQVAQRARRKKPSSDDNEDEPKSKKFDLRFLRPGLIVAAIVFLVLFKIAPLIAVKLPFSIDSVTGKFTTVGLFIVSFLAGGTFLFADEMLKKYT